MPDLQETKKRPYAGQTWTADLFSAEVSYLALIERDLITDARAIGVPLNSAIEFWANEELNLKGFFMGDTTSLADKGWTLLGTL